MSSATVSRPKAETPQPGARRTRRSRRAGDVFVALAGVGLGLVVGIQVATSTGTSGPGGLLIELSRWAGLVGTYLALLVIFLVARVPVIERAVGLDRMISWHREAGAAVARPHRGARRARHRGLRRLGRDLVPRADLDLPVGVPVGAAGVRGLRAHAGRGHHVVARGPTSDEVRDVVGHAPVLLPCDRARLPPPDHPGPALRHAHLGAVGLDRPLPAHVRAAAGVPRRAADLELDAAQPEGARGGPRERRHDQRLGERPQPRGARGQGRPVLRLALPHP